MHELKNVKNMVYEKQEKLHNTQNVNINYFKNMPKAEIHPEWFENATVFAMENHYVRRFNKKRITS